MENPKCRSRLSILIKAAELLYRDMDTMNPSDITYYLEQILQETEECLASYGKLYPRLPKKPDF